MIVWSVRLKGYVHRRGLPLPEILRGYSIDVRRGPYCMDEGFTAVCIFCV